MAYESYNELVQNLVNEDYDMLLSMARNSLQTLEPLYEVHESGLMLLICLMLRAAAIDGTFSKKEVQFLLDLTGAEHDDLYEVASVYAANRPALDDSIDAFILACPQDIKTMMIMLVICVMACDETVTAEENCFIQECFGM